MYTVKNFRTKKQLLEALANGTKVEVYQPGGLFDTPRNGTVYLEGPHYPEPHRWYAEAKLVDGLIVKAK